MIRKYFAPILIGSMFIIFLIVMAIGLYQTSLNPTLDKIPLEVQRIETDEPTNFYSFDGRPRSYDLRSHVENETFVYYKVFYRGTLNNGESVEFWQYVGYVDYCKALTYLGE